MSKILTRNTPKWLVDAENLKSPVKVLGAERVISYIVRESMEINKSEIGKYVVSLLVNYKDGHEFYFLTPELKMKPCGNDDTQNFGEAFNVFKTLRSVNLLYLNNKETFSSNEDIIYFDTWKIEEEDSRIFLNHHSSKRINKFRFECNLCQSMNKISDSDYLEYREYSSSYEDDEPPIATFECKRCSNSHHDLTIVLSKQ